MKLRIKIKDLSMSLSLTLGDDETTVQAVKQKIADEVHARIGLRIVSCALSLNGRDELSESVQESPLSELGVVGGDLLHVLGAEFDPPLTQRVVPVETPPASLRVEPASVDPADTLPLANEQEPEPAESGEPLLVRHARPGRLPRLLTWLAEQAPPDSPDHLLALALHALMLEAGMQPVEPAVGHGAAGGGFRASVAPGAPAPAAEPSTDTATAAVSDCRTAGYFPGGPTPPRRWHLPAGWKRPGLFQIKYGLHFNMALRAVLTIVPMGNTTVVHAVPEGGAQIFSVTLRARDFVVATESEDTGDRFQNLRQLSNAFKNGITVPLLVHLQRSVGLVSPHEWRALPLELQLLILRRLSVRDLLRVRCTCREMRARADDPLLWKDLLFRDFAGESGAYAALEPGADWKALYVRLHERRKAVRRRMEDAPPLQLPWPTPMPMPAVPSAGGWFGQPARTGIIGGEYDLRPSFEFQPPPPLRRDRLSGLQSGRRQTGGPGTAFFFGGGRLM